MSIYRSYLSDHTDDERRLARRDEIKRAIGERKTKQHRVDGLLLLLSEVKSDLEHAEAEHDATVEPMQKELSELDRKMVDAYAAGRTPKDDAARRRDLNRQVFEAGRELEITRQANHEQQRKLNREIDSLRSDIARAVTLETELSRLAPIDMQAEAKAVAELRTTLARLSSSLHEKMESMEHRLSDPTASFPPHGQMAGDLLTETIRVQCATLGAFMAELNSRGEELHRQMLEA